MTASSGLDPETITTTETIARLTAERDSAQEHLAYHLRDFRPGVDMAATGDLAVDMAAYAGRLKTERDRLRAGIEALADEWEAKAALHLDQSAQATDHVVTTAQAVMGSTYDQAASRLRALLSAGEEAVE